MNALKIAIIFFLACTIPVLLVGFTWVSYNNSEIGLRNAAVAQQKDNEASYDTMWKILQQKAGIVGKYKDDFQDIWPELIAGRYASGGSLMKWVQERNPTFDSSLYKDLMVSVEGERKSFLRKQEKLISIKQEHDNIRTKFPGVFIVGGRPAVEINIITSGQTKETFETGEENDVDLFKKEE